MDKQAKIALIGSLLLVGILIVSLVAAKPPRTQCRDGIDNDGDTFVDLNDPGCRNKNDLSELNLKVQCDDNRDNDGDNKIDYPDDFGCTSPSDNSETNSTTII